MAATVETAQAAIRRKFDEAGFPERADEFLALASPAIYFRAEPRTFEDDIPTGSSKIGGRPDLPVDCPWPADMQIVGTHLTLLAQLNLADVPHGALDIALPNDGLLLLFADAEVAQVGRLLWFPPETPLQRRSAPDGCHLFPTRRLRSDIVMTLDCERQDIPKTFIDDGMWEIAMDDREDNNLVQLGGDPHVIQTSLDYDCAREAGGEGRLAGADAEWVFIAQVDSVDEAEMNWGDGGSVYYLLRAGDLRERRFEHAFVTMQCY